MIFTAYNHEGEPLAGLSPDTWLSYVNVESGDVAPPPVVEEVGGGQYRTTTDPEHAGILDLGESASNRYVAILPGKRWGCLGWTDDGAPAPGLSPNWMRHVDAETGEALSPPPIQTVGNFFHTVPYSSAPRTVGLIDLGEGADPRLVEFDSQPPGSSDDTPPEVHIVAPVVGSTITPSTPIVLRVTDNAELGRVLLYAHYQGRQSTELIHDGGVYLEPYAESSRVPVTGGWRYTLRRAGGWPGSISLYVRAVDRSGNEVQVL